MLLLIFGPDFVTVVASFYDKDKLLENQLKVKITEGTDKSFMKYKKP